MTSVFNLFLVTETAEKKDLRDTATSHEPVLRSRPISRKGLPQYLGSVSQ